MKTPEEIENWLRARIAAEINAQPGAIALNIPFANYGLDSIVIVTIVSDLEEQLKTSLDPTIFWEYPTIETLTEWLAAEKLPG